MRLPGLIIPTLISVILCQSSSPQAPVGSAASPSISRTSAAGATSSFEGMRIDSLVVENRNVFNTREPGFNNILFRTANKLHIVTRVGVIRRELLLKPGDTFSTALAEETARNLRTRYDLYDVWIIPEKLPSGGLLVRVITQDQWSLLVGARVRREGNLTNYQFSLEDRNLLGRNQFLSFDYWIQQQDENYIQTVFSDQRFTGRPYWLQVTYRTKPTDRLTGLDLSHPYYNLQQRTSYGVVWQHDGGRDDYYQDNVLVGQDRRTGDNFELKGHYRWGSYNRKIGVVGGYQYRYQHFYDSTGTGHPPLSDSLFHHVHGGVSFENIIYAQTRRINGFTYTEDVTLGESLELQYGRAFKNGLADYFHDDVTAEGKGGFQFNKNLVLVGSEFTVWFRQNSHLRHAGNLSVRYYNTRLSYLTVAARGMYQVDIRGDEHESLYLGGNTGIRGYDAYFRSGERLMVGNLELRFFPNLELLTVRFGGAVFADVGRVWKGREAVDPNKTYASAGAGLRISAERASKLDILRIDVVRGQHGKWELSFGAGQYF